MFCNAQGRSQAAMLRSSLRVLLVAAGEEENE